MTNQLASKWGVNLTMRRDMIVDTHGSSLVMKQTYNIIKHTIQISSQLVFQI